MSRQLLVLSVPLLKRYVSDTPNCEPSSALPLHNELVLHAVVRVTFWGAPAVLHSQEEILHLVLPFHLQEDIEGVFQVEGERLLRVRLHIGSIVIEGHGHHEVPFFDSKLHKSTEERSQDYTHGHGLFRYRIANKAET